MLKSPWSRLAVAVTGPNHHATHAFYGAGLRGRNARQALQGTESRRQIASSGNELLDFAMNKREITYQNMGDINGVVGLRNYCPRQELRRKGATSCDSRVLYCPDEYRLSLVGLAAQSSINTKKAAERSPDHKPLHDTRSNTVPG